VSFDSSPRTREGTIGERGGQIQHETRRKESNLLSLLTEQATSTQQRSVFHASNPRQIHALLRLQETLTEPCELVISQLQASSWTRTPIRLCVVIKLHPARGFDITDPSSPQPRPRLGLPVRGERLEGGDVPEAHARNMRNMRKSTDVHSRADKALIQVRDAVVSAVQSAQLPQHVRALCLILIRNRRMRVVEGKFVAISITAAVNACDTETS